MQKFSKYMILMAGCVLYMGAQAPNAYAVKYTTNDSGTQKEDAKQVPKGSKENPKGKNTKEEKKDTSSCTDEHKSAIRSFNDKAIRKMDEFDALLANKDQIDTPREAKEFTKELEKLQDFYHSAEFSIMEEIYALCGVDLPRPKEELPYFLPEDLGIGDEVDAI